MKMLLNGEAFVYSYCNKHLLLLKGKVKEQTKLRIQQVCFMIICSLFRVIRSQDLVR